MISTKPRNKGVYLLPNLFTTAALFSGFFAIVAGMQERFEVATIAIYIAMLFDGLDGRVARLTNTQTAFGREFDSLSDMVAFGVAPALVAYSWALYPLGKLGWLSAFIYTVGNALRLARFNVQAGTLDNNFFSGLPVPSAAAIIAGLVWVGDGYGWSSMALSWMLAFLSVAVALLMVSSIPYYSFKKVNLRGKVPMVTIFLLALGFAFISIDPPVILFSIFCLYGLSGPVLWAGLEIKNRPRWAKLLKFRRQMRNADKIKHKDIS